MPKPEKPHSSETQIVHPAGGKAPAADMDNLVTTIRTRTAGQIVITDGPGKGQTVSFFEGSNSIGRDAGKNVVVLDFGDSTIHREPHAYLTCKSRVCTLSPGGQQNPIKINGRMLTGTEPVAPGDVIQLGMTSLKIELV